MEKKCSNFRHSLDWEFTNPERLNNQRLTQGGRKAPSRGEGRALSGKAGLEIHTNPTNTTTQATPAAIAVSMTAPDPASLARPASG